MTEGYINEFIVIILKILCDIDKYQFSIFENSYPVLFFLIVFSKNNVKITLFFMTFLYILLPNKLIDYHIGLSFPRAIIHKKKMANKYKYSSKQSNSGNKKMIHNKI